MTERGTVISVDGGIKVRIEKKTECGKCGMCAFPGSASHIDVTVKSDIEVKAGDTVTVEISDGGKFLGALFAFGVPLVLIVACVLLGTLVFNNDTVTAVSSIMSVVVWWIVLHFIDKLLAKNRRFISKITAVEKIDLKINQGE